MVHLTIWVKTSKTTSKTIEHTIEGDAATPGIIDSIRDLVTEKKGWKAEIRVDSVLRAEVRLMTVLRADGSSDAYLLES